MEEETQAMGADSEPLAMTPEEVAALLRLTTMHVAKLAKSGKLPGFKVGGQWRFRRAEIMRLLEGGQP